MGIFVQGREVEKDEAASASLEAELDEDVPVTMSWPAAEEGLGLGMTSNVEEVLLEEF